MATFRDRDSGYVQAIVRRKGWPVQSKTFRSRTEAESWAKRIEVDIERGVFQSASDAERNTFTDIVERFKTEFAPHHYRPRQDQKEAWRFQLARLNDFFGAYSLAAIDQKLTASFRDQRLKGTNDRQPVSESTVRKELFMLSKVLGFAETECGIQLPRGNPVEKIRKPTDGKARDRRLTAQEWKALEAEIASSRSPWLKPAFYFAVETAMRQGEMLNLQRRDIDLKRKIAMIRESKNGEVRAAPLTSHAIHILESMPRVLEGNIFPVDRLTLYHAFVAACKRAKINNYTWHDLRHEALSRLAERGDLSVLELAAVSGHKTLQMLKRYTHLQTEKLAQKLG